MINIKIEVSGGIVQGVYSDNAQDVEITIVDFDTEGVPDEEVCKLPLKNGKESDDCYSYRMPIINSPYKEEK